MKTEDLKKLGIEDEEIIKQIHALAGKDIEKVKGEAESYKAQVDSLTGQVSEAAKQIEAFKGMDIEGVKKSADEWKSKAEAAQAEASKQIASLRFDHALESALAAAKAKNAKAVKALLKADDLKLTEEGSILGLPEQLEKIKSEADYLFESEKADPKIITGGSGKSVITDSAVLAARKAAGLPVE